MPPLVKSWTAVEHRRDIVVLVRRVDSAAISAAGETGAAQKSGLEIHAAILRCHEIPDILGGKRCLLAPNSPLSKKRARTPSSPPQPLSGIKGRRGRSVDVRRRRHASILSLVSLPESQAWPE